MTPHEDEDYDLTTYNIEQGVVDSIINNMQYTEEDGNDDKYIVAKRKEPLANIKNNHSIENLIGYLDECFTPWRKYLKEVVNFERNGVRKIILRPNSAISLGGNGLERKRLMIMILLLETEHD